MLLLVAVVLGYSSYSAAQWSTLQPIKALLSHGG